MKANAQEFGKAFCKGTPYSLEISEGQGNRTVRTTCIHVCTYLEKSENTPDPLVIVQEFNPRPTSLLEQTGHSC